MNGDVRSSREGRFGLGIDEGLEMQHVSSPRCIFFWSFVIANTNEYLKINASRLESH